MVKCKYKKEFPVDEWDRPGGFYSLADVPIFNMKVLERTGIIVSRDTNTQLYKIKDDDNLAMQVIVPMKDVEIIDGG